MYAAAGIGFVVGLLTMAFYLKKVGNHKRLIDMLRGSEPQDG